MRLNGWQRLGVVLSLAWVPCGAVYGCELGFAAECNPEQLHALMVFYTFAPVVAGWVFSWLAVWAARWVWRGFSSPR